MNNFLKLVFFTNNLHEQRILPGKLFIYIRKRIDSQKES